jgi:hypothetical protein
MCEANRKRGFGDVVQICHMARSQAPHNSHTLSRPNIVFITSPSYVIANSTLLQSAIAIGNGTLPQRQTEFTDRHTAPTNEVYVLYHALSRKDEPCRAPMPVLAQGTTSAAAAKRV